MLPAKSLLSNRSTLFKSPPLTYDDATRMINSQSEEERLRILYNNPELTKDLAQALAPKAIDAAIHVLSGEPAAVKKLIEEHSVFLLYSVVQVKDRHENQVKGTLLQIAALAGDFNFPLNNWNSVFAYFTQENGIVEMLTAYLPPAEAIKQLEETRPADWEKDTNERMQPYIDAITQFLKDILNTPQVKRPLTGEIFQRYTAATAAYHRKLDQPQSNDQRSKVTEDFEKEWPESSVKTHYGDFKIECENHIKKFTDTLKAIPSIQPLVTTGFIFNPYFLKYFFEDLFVKNVYDLGGWNSDKTRLFLIIAFGNIQLYTSACDLQFMHMRKDPGSTGFRSLTAPDVPGILEGVGDKFFIDPLDGARFTQFSQFDSTKVISKEWAMACIAVLESYSTEKTKSMNIALGKHRVEESSSCVLM